MNRDEAKQLVTIPSSSNRPDRYYDAIDKVYDDFEARKCDNCTHKPNEGENYLDPCGTCSWFYTDNFRPKP